MAIRKSIYVYTAVADILEKYLPGIRFYSRRGRVPGRISMSGALRFMTVGFDQMIESVDHGLSDAEVKFAADAIGRPQEEGDIPVERIWVDVMMYRGDIPKGIDAESVYERIKGMDTCQLYKLAAEMIKHQVPPYVPDEQEIADEEKARIIPAKSKKKD